MKTNSKEQLEKILSQLEAPDLQLEKIEDLCRQAYHIVAYSVEDPAKSLFCRDMQHRINEATRAMKYKSKSRINELKEACRKEAVFNFRHYFRTKVHELE